MSRRQRASIDQTKPIRKNELLKKNLFWTFTSYLRILLSGISKISIRNRIGGYFQRV